MKRSSYYKAEQPASFDSSDDLIEYAREYYSSDFPNPERAGCPDTGVISELAESGTLPGEDIRSHLFRCSECFNYYSEAQLKLRRLSNAQPATWWGAVFSQALGRNLR